MTDYLGLANYFMTLSVALILLKGNPLVTVIILICGLACFIKSFQEVEKK